MQHVNIYIPLQGVCMRTLPLRVSNSLPVVVCSFFCLIALLLPPGLCLAAAPDAAGEEQTAAPGIAYQPVISGSPTEEMLEAFQAVSKCFTLQKTPPESILLLKRRMTGDIDAFMQVLRSFGYFKAKVAPTLKESTQPPTVNFQITPGPRFNWDNVVFVSSTPEGDPPELPSPADTGIVAGKPYAAVQVSEAKSAILKKLRNQSYPFPKIASQKIIANFADNKVNLTLDVAAGRKAKFGKTSFSGLKNVKEDYARTFITWEYGAPYDAELAEKCRNALIRSGLFSLARIDPDKVNAEGYLPLTIDVVERKPRTFSAGVRYRSDDGPGGKIGWEHRSIFGRGELLKLAIDGDMKQQSFTADFRKPSLFTKEQDLVAKGKMLRERRDAYDSDSAELTVGIERRLNKKITVGLGSSYRMADVTQDDETTRYSYISIPAKLSWDTRNDLLDPSAGGLLSLWGAPYGPLSGIPNAFGQTLVSYTHFLQLVSEKMVILALRANFGSSFGITLDDLPADIRYYSGGMGSVRGFAHQYAGDLKNDDPVGGRSVMDATAEIRFRFLEKYGLNFFVDAGRAYSEQLPTFDDPFLGAGIGLRYYSPFGPVGLDFAVPLNGRSGTDAPYQFYITLGQSF